MIFSRQFPGDEFFKPIPQFMTALLFGFRRLHPLEPSFENLVDALPQFIRFQVVLKLALVAEESAPVSSDTTSAMASVSSEMPMPAR
jgi:hypothetical protein